MGSKNNQEWVQVPTERLKDRISQLCEQRGIQFIETEESYTSKAYEIERDRIPLLLGAYPDASCGVGHKARPDNSGCSCRLPHNIR